MFDEAESFLRYIADESKSKIRYENVGLSTVVLHCDFSEQPARNAQDVYLTIRRILDEMAPKWFVILYHDDWGR
jgi:hypothetical protein